MAVRIEVRLEQSTQQGSLPTPELPLLLLVATARSAATVEPPVAEYVSGGEPAVFVFTASKPGPHCLRFTVYDRDIGVVLQDLETSIDVVMDSPTLVLDASGPGERN